MDPLSITAAALGFAGVCTCILRNIKDTISRLQDVPQSLSNLERGIGLTVAVLSEVDRMLRANRDMSTPIPQEQRIVYFLGGCQHTLQGLQLELEGMIGLESWISKAAVMWREDEISRMLVSLEQEKQSLNIIVGILNTRSIDETNRSLGRMQASIDNLNERLSGSIITPENRVFPHRELVQSPRMDDDTTLVETTPSRESSPSSTEFPFDEEIVNTKVYRKALARLSRGRKRRLSSSSVLTANPLARAPLGEVQNQSHGTANKAVTRADGDRPSKKRKGDETENMLGYFEDYIHIFEDYQI